MSLFRRLPTEYKLPEDELFRDNLNRDVRGQIDYAAIRDYAAKLFEGYEKDDKAIDDKGDALLRASGAGSALVLVGLVLAFKPPVDPAFQQFLREFFLWALPSLASLAAAVVLVLAARKPRDYPRPEKAMYVAARFEEAAGDLDGRPVGEDDKAVLNRHLLAQYNLAAERTLAVVKLKGYYLRWAYRAYALSILLTGIPIGFVAYAVR